MEIDTGKRRGGVLHSLFSTARFKVALVVGVAIAYVVAYLPLSHALSRIHRGRAFG